jgi:ubiquinone/menaquinone biosynthesis C-methylase UbiE
MKEIDSEKPLRITRQIDRVHHQVMDSVAVSIKGLQPKRILDVGTGYGMNLTFLARRFGKCSRIWSVDASPKVVHEIKKTISEHAYSRHIIVKQANAEKLPLRTDYFGLVVSVFSLHHLSNAKRGLAEMGRVLSHGGKLIVADWRPAAGKPLMLHARGDIPSSSFVNTQLKRLGYRTKSTIRPYWYSIEAMK